MVKVEVIYKPNNQNEINDKLVMLQSKGFKIVDLKYIQATDGYNPVCIIMYDDNAEKSKGFNI